MDVFSIRRVCRCYGLGGFNVRGVVFAKKERHKVAPRRPRRGAGPPAVGADHRVCYRTGPRGGGGRTHGLPPLTAAASAGHSHVRATPPCYHSALHRFTPFVRLWATVKGPQTASSKSAQTASRIGSRPATAARGPGSLRKARSRPPEVPRIDQGGRGGGSLEVRPGTLRKLRRRPPGGRPALCPGPPARASPSIASRAASPWWTLGASGSVLVFKERGRQAPARTAPCYAPAS